jgi:hypothetical protein
MNMICKVGGDSAWFDAVDPVRTISTDYKMDCRPCHVPAQASRWIYIQGYPALKVEFLNAGHKNDARLLVTEQRRVSGSHVHHTGRWHWQAGTPSRRRI